MSSYIFLGPSLSHDTAQRIFPAHYLPPARMGDVFAVMAHRPKAIGIIDGYFESTPAVWHKEILYALSQGVRVFGGASMGALRAAEMHIFGMRGVGYVYDSYVSGEIEDDDEVAMIHSNANTGYRKASEAMINIRYGLAAAHREGIITETTRCELVNAVKKYFYPDRSWQLVYHLGTSLSIPLPQLSGLSEFISHTRPDVKRMDAECVLTTMAADLVRDEPAGSPPVTFEPTFFWEHLVSMWERVSVPSSENTFISAEQIRNHARFAERDRSNLRKQALLLFLAAREASRGGIEVPDVRNAVRRFRSERGLKTAADLSEYLRAEKITQEDFTFMSSQDAVVRALEIRYAPQIDALLPTVLRTESRWAAMLERVGAKSKLLADLGVSSPTVGDTGETMAELLTWYQGLYGSIHTTLDEHVAEVGFGSVRQFLTELFSERIACKQKT